MSDDHQKFVAEMKRKLGKDFSLNDGAPRRTEDLEDQLRAALGGTMSISFSRWATPGNSWPTSEFEKPILDVSADLPPNSNVDVVELGPAISVTVEEELGNTHRDIDPATGAYIELKEEQLAKDETPPRILSMLLLSKKSLCRENNSFDSHIFLHHDLSFYHWDYLIRAYGLERFLKENIPIVLLYSSFGVIHLMPDVCGIVNFPTHIERLIWRVSCYLIISFAACALFSFLLTWMLGRSLRSILPPVNGARKKTALNGIDMVVEPVWKIYSYALIVVRLYFVVESFISLRKERPEIFLTPDWNWLDYIPHI